MKVPPPGEHLGAPSLRTVQDFRVNPRTLHPIRTPPVAHLPHPGRREGCLDRRASEGETMVTTQAEEYSAVI